MSHFQSASATRPDIRALQAFDARALDAVLYRACQFNASLSAHDPHARLAAQGGVLHMPLEPAHASLASGTSTLQSPPPPPAAAPKPAQPSITPTKAPPRPPARYRLGSMARSSVVPAASTPSRASEPARLPAGVQRLPQGRSCPVDAMQLTRATFTHIFSEPEVLLVTTAGTQVLQLPLELYDRLRAHIQRVQFIHVAVALAMHAGCTLPERAKWLFHLLAVCAAQREQLEEGEPATVQHYRVTAHGPTELQLHVYHIEKLLLVAKQCCVALGTLSAEAASTALTAAAAAFPPISKQYFGVCANEDRLVALLQPTGPVFLPMQHMLRVDPGSEIFSSLMSSAPALEARRRVALAGSNPSPSAQHVQLAMAMLATEPAYWRKPTHIVTTVVGSGDVTEDIVPQVFDVPQSEYHTRLLVALACAVELEGAGLHALDVCSLEVMRRAASAMAARRSMIAMHMPQRLQLPPAVQAARGFARERLETWRMRQLNVERFVAWCHDGVLAGDVLCRVRQSVGPGIDAPVLCRSMDEVLQATHDLEAQEGLHDSSAEPKARNGPGTPRNESQAHITARKQLRSTVALLGLSIQDVQAMGSSLHNVNTDGTVTRGQFQVIMKPFVKALLQRREAMWEAGIARRSAMSQDVAENDLESVEQAMDSRMATDTAMRKWFGAVLPHFTGGSSRAAGAGDAQRSEAQARRVLAASAPRSTPSAGHADSDDEGTLEAALSTLSSRVSESHAIDLLSLIDDVNADDAGLESSALQKLLDALYIAFDADGNGMLDTTELCVGVSRMIDGEMQAKLDLVFSLLDLDQSGRVSLLELMIVILGGSNGLRRNRMARARRVTPVSLLRIVGPEGGSASGAAQVTARRQALRDLFSSSTAGPKPDAAFQPPGVDVSTILFARRVAMALDTNQDGMISREEWHEAVKASDGVLMSAFTESLDLSGECGPIFSFGLLQQLVETYSVELPTLRAKASTPLDELFARGITKWLFSRLLCEQFGCPTHLQSLSPRIFGAFDSNGDGVVSIKEMFFGLQRATRGTITERASFVFNLFADRPYPGAELAIDVERLQSLLEASQETGRVNATDARAIMAAVDANKDGMLQEAEFMQVAIQRPSVLTSLSRIFGAHALVDTHDLEEPHDEQRDSDSPSPEPGAKRFSKIQGFSLQSPIALRGVPRSPSNSSVGVGASTFKVPARSVSGNPKYQSKLQAATQARQRAEDSEARRAHAQTLRARARAVAAKLERERSAVLADQRRMDVIMTTSAAASELAAALTAEYDFAARCGDLKADAPSPTTPRGSSPRTHAVAVAAATGSPPRKHGSRPIVPTLDLSGVNARSATTLASATSTGGLYRALTSLSQVRAAARQAMDSQASLPDLEIELKQQLTASRAAVMQRVPARVARSPRVRRAMMDAGNAKVALTAAIRKASRQVLTAEVATNDSMSLKPSQSSIVLTGSCSLPVTSQAGCDQVARRSPRTRAAFLRVASSSGQLGLVKVHSPRS